MELLLRLQEVTPPAFVVVSCDCYFVNVQHDKLRRFPSRFLIVRTGKRTRLTFCTLSIIWDVVSECIRFVNTQFGQRYDTLNNLAMKKKEICVVSGKDKNLKIPRIFF